MRLACVKLPVILALMQPAFAGGAPRAVPATRPIAGVAASASANNAATAPLTENLAKGSVEDVKAAREAMKAFIDGLIRGDDKRVMDQLSITDTDRGVAEAMFGLICATQRLRQAALEAHIDLSGVDLGATEDDGKRLEVAVVASVPTIQGDTAKMVLNDDTYELKRVGGAWKLDFAATQKHMGDMPPAAVVQQSKKKMAAYDALSADVKNGKVKTTQEIKDTLAAIEKEGK
ncbi:MAG TPA: hypothetical protein VGN88_11560 [Phycisphaerae bacterium]